MGMGPTNEITGERARTALAALPGNFIVAKFTAEEWERREKDERTISHETMGKVLDATEDSNNRFFREGNTIVVQFPDDRRWCIFRDVRDRN